MNIAIYLRVSTDRQTTQSQAVELREYCARRGWNDVREFSDTASGAKFSREGLDALMREVRKGRIDIVVAYKLDRLGRSLAHLAQLIGEFTASYGARHSGTGHRYIRVQSSESVTAKHFDGRCRVRTRDHPRAR
jgi:Site-specific recombinases, DNA invertase Pin homologs